MNNSVYHNGKVVGFRCHKCDEVKSKMWGTTCNSCREEDRKHKELLEVNNKTNDHSGWEKLKLLSPYTVYLMGFASALFIVGGITLIIKLFI